MCMSGTLATYSTPQQQPRLLTVPIPEGWVKSADVAQACQYLRFNSTSTILAASSDALKVSSGTRKLPVLIKCHHCRFRGMLVCIWLWSMNHSACLSCCNVQCWFCREGRGFEAFGPLSRICLLAFLAMSPQNKTFFGGFGLFRVNFDQMGAEMSALRGFLTSGRG